MKASPLLQGACLTHLERTVVDGEHLNHEIVRNRYSFPAFKVDQELHSGKAYEKRFRPTLESIWSAMASQRWSRALSD
jgi:hypothetical protein